MHQSHSTNDRKVLFYFWPFLPQGLSPINPHSKASLVLNYSAVADCLKATEKFVEI